MATTTEHATALIVTAETGTPVHRGLRHARDAHGFDLILLPGQTGLRWRDAMCGYIEPGVYETAIEALSCLCPDTEAMIAGEVA